MLRGVRRYVRERFEKKLVNKKKEKTENAPNKRVVSRRYYNSAAFVPRFAHQLFVIKEKNNERGNYEEGTCKSFNILEHSWAETFGLVCSVFELVIELISDDLRYKTFLLFYRVVLWHLDGL